MFRHASSSFKYDTEKQNKIRLSIFIFRFCFRDLGKTHSQEIGALFKCNTY